MVQNADIKRNEIERLQKELKQLKEKYRNKKQKLLSKGSTETDNVEESETVNKFEQLEIHTQPELETDNGSFEVEGEMAEEKPDITSATSSSDLQTFDSQPGPSGLYMFLDFIDFNLILYSIKVYVHQFQFQILVLNGINNHLRLFQSYLLLIYKIVSIKWRKLIILHLKNYKQHCKS